MRFMLFMIPKVYQTNEPPAMPTAEQVAEMMQFNDSLVKAGVLLSLDGLYPPTMATRLAFTDKQATVTDGPFSEAKEAVGGYWLVECCSQEEAVQWASRCPAQDGDVIEVRRVQDIADFPADVRAEISPEIADLGK